MRLEISSEDVAAILAEAVASPGREVCGLLLGDGLRVDEVQACRNVADQPETSFEIDPAALIAAHKAARANGWQIIGHYHSHPSGLAEPSARDAAAAQGGEIWLIVADGTAAAWLVGDEKSFASLEIQPSS